MVPSAQIVVTGFHRSGTSMSMQALKRAGLHIGSSLIGADPSNPDGHFEDIETVNLHNRWLDAAGIDWCCSEQPPALSLASAKPVIQTIAQRLGNTHKQWAVKDPRAALYLNEWFNSLNEPYGIFVYRHFASCLSSLQRRQADALFTNPSTENADIRFWMDPDIALQSWLVHNKALLKQVQKHPTRCILVSQEAQIAGTNLASLVTSKLPVLLQVNSTSGVDIRKTQTQQNITLLATHWEKELEATWAELQALSLAPAEQHPSVQWITSSQAETGTTIDDVIRQLDRCWDKLAIPSA